MNSTSENPIKYKRISVSSYKDVSLQEMSRALSNMFGTSEVLCSNVTESGVERKRRGESVLFFKFQKGFEVKPESPFCWHGTIVVDPDRVNLPEKKLDVQIALAKELNTPLLVEVPEPFWDYGHSLLIDPERGNFIVMEVVDVEKSTDDNTEFYTDVNQCSWVPYDDWCKGKNLNVKEEV